MKGLTWMSMGIAALFIGCSGDAERGPVKQEDGERIVIDLDSGDADRLLGFYFGGFVGDNGGDPVEAGILQKREKTWYLRTEGSWSDRISPESRTSLSSLVLEAEDGRLAEDAIESYVQETYYQIRHFPANLYALRDEAGGWTEPEWFRIDLVGSMVPLVRRTWVLRSAIEDALDAMSSLADPVLYPVGTMFIGEHLDSDTVVETTVMRKRSDGYWDFWAYDAEGQIVDRVRKEPRDMLVPTRCTGCHFGDRQFEPERSFPVLARPGPNGERTLFVPESWRNGDLSSSLQEHARRSDTILGLYATLYLAEAASDVAAGERPRSRYLEKFGIDSSGQ